MRGASWWMVLACGVACGAEEGGGDPGESAAEVVRGMRDRGASPFVVALRTNDGALCSGTLVGPRWVLTARHCVSRTVAHVDCARAGRQVFAERDPWTIRVLAGDDARTGVELARGHALRVPPGDRLCGADVAVLVLDRAVRSIAPAALGSAPARGARVRVVGFGRRGDSVRAGVGERFRREGVRVLARGATEFVTGPGVCSGDSGGPAIEAGSGAVVGVLSRGDARCADPEAENVYTRLDAFGPWLQGALR